MPLRGSFFLALALFLPAFCCGCATYHVGNAALYPRHIQTVFVPIFESASYRRDLAERVTEAVIKEIEVRTPYKVVNTPDADSVLTGRIVADTKKVVVVSPTADNRELEMGLVVRVTWTDRRGATLREGKPIPFDNAAVDVHSTAMLVPEVGQSVASQQQQAIGRIAQHVVGLMESPWEGPP